MIKRVNMRIKIQMRLNLTKTDNRTLAFSINTVHVNSLPCNAYFEKDIMFNVCYIDFHRCRPYKIVSGIRQYTR